MTDAPLSYDTAGAGRPLVLLHAFPLDRRMYRSQLADLSPHARLIIPDLPGFGASAPIPDASIDNFARKVSQLLDLIGVTQPVTICGVSMGGYVALAFARLFPKRLAGLILADTRAEADSPEALAAREKMLALVAEKGTPGVVEAMQDKVLGQTTRESRREVVEEYRLIALKQKPDSIAAGIAALRDRPNAADVLASVKVPILILVGEEDGVTPPEAAEAMKTLAPHAELYKLPGAGHLSNMESPGGFNAYVREFVAGV